MEHVYGKGEDRAYIHDGGLGKIVLTKGGSKLEIKLKAINALSDYDYTNFTNNLRLCTTSGEKVDLLKKYIRKTPYKGQSNILYISEKGDIKKLKEKYEYLEMEGEFGGIIGDAEDALSNLGTEESGENEKEESSLGGSILMDDSSAGSKSGSSVSDHAPSRKIEHRQTDKNIGAGREEHGKK
jgi:hypothetical protein